MTLEEKIAQLSMRCFRDGKDIAEFNGQGLLSIESVRPVLRLKYRLGLFAPPTPISNKWKKPPMRRSSASLS
jgi:hypothetical protein